MYEFFNWLLTFFLNVPTQVYVLVLGAAGVSVLSQVFKKWFKIENERWMFLVVMGIALAGSVLDWFLSSNSLPPQIIGIQTSILVGIAQPIYFYAIKPLNLVIAGYRANKASIQAKVDAIETAPTPSTTNTLSDAETAIGGLQSAATTANASAPTVAQVTSTPTPVEGAVAAALEPIETPRPVATF